MKLLKLPHGLLINFFTNNISKSMKPMVMSFSEPCQKSEERLINHEGMKVHEEGDMNLNLMEAFWSILHAISLLHVSKKKL